MTLYDFKINFNLNIDKFINLTARIYIIDIQTIEPNDTYLQLQSRIY